MPTVKIQLINPNAHVPRKARIGDAAFDLRIPDTVYILPKRRHTIPLGFALEIPEGYCAKVLPRSGFASKGVEGLDACDKSPERFDADIEIGLVDPNYRGQVGIIVNNRDARGFHIPAGTRLAQMRIERTEPVGFEVCGELSSTERGAEGFGSTGAV